MDNEHSPFPTHDDCEVSRFKSLGMYISSNNEVQEQQASRCDSWEELERCLCGVKVWTELRSRSCDSGRHVPDRERIRTLREVFCFVVACSFRNATAAYTSGLNPDHDISDFERHVPTSERARTLRGVFCFVVACTQSLDLGH